MLTARLWGAPWGQGAPHPQEAAWPLQSAPAPLDPRACNPGLTPRSWVPHEDHNLTAVSAVRPRHRHPRCSVQRTRTAHREGPRGLPCRTRWSRRAAGLGDKAPSSQGSSGGAAGVSPAGGQSRNRRPVLVGSVLPQRLGCRGDSVLLVLRQRERGRRPAMVSTRHTPRPLQTSVKARGGSLVRRVRRVDGA